MPVLLMTSGGGLTSLQTAMQFPIRLVESGPAGGAILASHIATELGLEKVISFDMGGTTAKICLIEDGKPQTAREFEVDRAARFIKGSGLPLRIPVIEMVEIGAGGGSIARLDAMQRITIGPDSAGADPGPAAYGRGGTQPTITDADIALGRISPEHFAGGKVPLAPQKAATALLKAIGEPLGADVNSSGFGVVEMVDETMANAARVHAVERGKVAAEHAVVAFGGAAPLHVGRVAEKLGANTIVVPTDAGVGSAIGFLRAPVAYEVVRSLNMRLKDFDADVVNALMEKMREEALAVVRAGAPKTPLEERPFAYMRYLGQGHEIVVDLPSRPLVAEDAKQLKTSFDTAYERLYKRIIPAAEVEILTWAIAVSSPSKTPPKVATRATGGTAKPIGRRPVFEGLSGKTLDVDIYERGDLHPGATVAGPALIVEPATSTYLTGQFKAVIADNGHIVMQRI